LLYRPDGKIMLDPDIEVQSAIRMLFDTFDRTASAMKTARFLREQGLQFPSRLQSGPNKGELVWALRARLAPMLYDEDDKAAAEALRESPVAKAQRSPAALAKSATGRTADGAPVHSFQTLLADLATLAGNTVVTAGAPNRPFTSSPVRPRSNKRPSISWDFPSPVPSSSDPKTARLSEIKDLCAAHENKLRRVGKERFAFCLTLPKLLREQRINSQYLEAHADKPFSHIDRKTANVTNCPLNAIS